MKRLISIARANEPADLILALPVIPELRLADLGLVDVSKFKLIE